MTQAEMKHLTILETKFETIVEPMALKVDTIYDNFKENNRKVNEHHKLYNVWKDANCPDLKVMPGERQSDGNGGYLERRTKKPLRRQFKEMPLCKKISSAVVVITFFAAFGEWLLAKGHSILYLLETMFK